jgi:hypothetical protein
MSIAQAFLLKSMSRTGISNCMLNLSSPRQTLRDAVLKRVNKWMTLWPKQTWCCKSKWPPFSILLSTRLYSNVLARRQERPKHLTNQIKVPLQMAYGTSLYWVTQPTVRPICVKHVSKDTPCFEIEKDDKKLMRETHNAPGAIYLSAPTSSAPKHEVSDACATPRPPRNAQ